MGTNMGFAATNPIPPISRACNRTDNPSARAALEGAGVETAVPLTIPVFEPGAIRDWEGRKLL